MDKLVNLTLKEFYRIFVRIEDSSSVNVKHDIFVRVRSNGVDNQYGFLPNRTPICVPARIGMSSNALAHRICGLAHIGATRWRLFCVKEYVNLYFGEDSGVEVKLTEDMGNDFSFAFNCKGPRITPICVEQCVGWALTFFVREQWYINTDLIPNDIMSLVKSRLQTHNILRILNPNDLTFTILPFVPIPDLCSVIVLYSHHEYLNLELLLKFL